MFKDSKALSVIIPNYNGLKYLKNCLNSLEKVKSNNLNIIIIDNGSDDDSLEFLSGKWKSKFRSTTNSKSTSRSKSDSSDEDKIPSNIKYKIIYNKENIGFANAVNQGIKASSTEYVFLLNNDTEIEENTIKNLIKTIEKDENIFSVSSKMIQYNDLDLIDDAGDEYTILGWTKKVGEGKPSNLYTEEREIFSSCAGAALYKKSLFEKIGYFDGNFFAYMEDVDIAYRANIEGYKNIYCPEAIVYHVGSGSSGSRYNEFKIKLAARNNIWVILKNMPIIQIILNIGFLALGFFIKYLFFLKKGHGSVYLDGLKEGIKNKDKINKVKFKFSNLNNYFRIEYMLIKNIFKYFQ